MDVITYPYPNPNSSESVKEAQRNRGVKQVQHIGVDCIIKCKGEDRCRITCTESTPFKPGTILFEHSCDYA